MLHRFLMPRTVAVGRTGLGATMLVRPRLVPQLLGIDSATAARTSWALQLLGAREVALGLGTLIGKEGRLWILAGLLTDATDAVVMSGSVLRGRVKASTGLLSVAVAVTSSAVAIEELRTARKGE